MADFAQPAVQVLGINEYSKPVKSKQKALTPNMPESLKKSPETTRPIMR